MRTGNHRPRSDIFCDIAARPTELTDQPNQLKEGVVADEAADRPEALLLRALESLPEAHRHDVLRWLFERIPQAVGSVEEPGTGPTDQPPGSWADFTPSRTGPRAHRGQAKEVREEALAFGMSDPMRGDYQMVPVRLPTADHARLRAWSQEHGFAMATIIRGLLARFLDEQHPGRPDAAQAG